MRTRYLIVLPRHGGAAVASADRLARLTGLEPLSTSDENSGILALASPQCRLYRIADGVVLGTLFHRHGPSRALEPGGRESHDLARADARLLRDRYWGGYVAVLDRNRPVAILRDPSGGLPCYLRLEPDRTLVASDAELLFAAAAAKPQIDWKALGRHLWGNGLPTASTALSGVLEVQPGSSLDPERPGGQQAWWSPWDHVEARRDRRGDDTAERLADTVAGSVRALASPFRRLLLSVSGGLDSSTVAASLAGRREDVVCLTMYGDDPDSDERDHARTLCDHLGLRLIERPYCIEDVDIEAPLAPHLPRPVGWTHALSYDRAHLDIAAVEGADAFVTGNGGDAVYGFSQSAASAVDRFRREGVAAGLASMADVMRQTGCGPILAARHALRIGRGGAAQAWKVDPSFLAPAVAETLIATPLAHHWLEAPPGALPGKAAHIASILRMHQTLETGRAASLPVLNPLLAQPVIEACLAIPSWAWRAGGIDRAVARQAFARALPASIAWRRTKGGPDAFAGLVLTRHRGRIRERLVSGELARQGLVDAGALDRVLAASAAVSGKDRARLLALLNTEAWIHWWQERGAQSLPRAAPALSESQ